MTQGNSQTENAVETDEYKKLILCFDGTGNIFHGTNEDTNVVKILRKLDRNHQNQFHYYQTGIGTYDVNETSTNPGPISAVHSKVSKVLDQSFGTTFDAHVMAGYKFLMRYFEPDAKIYIFGFSRGAYTAKYLARMISEVGLLCRGNEEMVPFAYRLYQRSLENQSADRVDAQKKAKAKENGKEQFEKTTIATNHHESEVVPLLSEGFQSPGPRTPPKKRKEAKKKDNEDILAGDLNIKKSVKTIAAMKEMKAFSETFCKNAAGPCEPHKNIQVFFLGMWDCVNSVRMVENYAPAPIAVTGTAQHIRHAVAVDERRVKFKPALLAQDIRASVNDKNADIREVWFSGNHGDVGGGWQAFDLPEDDTWWKRIKGPISRYLLSLKSENFDNRIILDDERLQMSDMALEWMIREVDRVGKKDPRSRVHWSDSLEDFKGLMANQDIVNKRIINGFQHDCLSFGKGSAFFKVIIWKIMEIMPLIPRWELINSDDPKKKGWVAYRGRPNFFASRDIPKGAILHDSLRRRLEDVGDYKPKNNHGDRVPGEKRQADESEHCLRSGNKIAKLRPYINPHDESEPLPVEPWDDRHSTWKFDYPEKKVKKRSATLHNGD
ncbi:hypothetical protein NW762_014751 [Fusarium torreyae]|uniref:T6SS Phospholipase effector Tle1-like catalytic domain-containing protein n=1 Tax=Fusarium torreyae TaxID=1237075 RepID=A0A9W8RL59_9HYPO|nr:hypothetical protein NW762_014751 [Fusarium torreyae]